MGRLPPTHVDDPTAVGARIRHAREAAGLSLRKVSFAGCSAGFLSRVESGTRVPSQQVLDELARRLQVDPEELAGIAGTGEVPQWRISDVEMAVRLADTRAESAAAALLEDGRKLNDSSATGRALEALGHLAMDRRADDRAIELFGEALDADPGICPRERPALYQALGRAHAGTGDVGRAVAVLQDAFDDASREPLDVPLMVRFGSYLANAHTDHGRFAEAERVLARLLRHERDMRDLLTLVRMDFALARTYAEKGRSRLAERYSRRLLARLEHSEEHPTLGRAHQLLAEILIDRRDHDGAEHHLAEAARLITPTAARPELALVSIDRAKLALIRNDYGRAGQLARDALSDTEATEPGIAGQAYLVLARVALEGDSIDEARTLCMAAVAGLAGRAAPHYQKEALQLLSHAEERAGNLDAALQAARQAADLAVGATLNS
jgi:transcriptional regulator with XRE-family HTH domain